MASTPVTAYVTLSAGATSPKLGDNLSISGAGSNSIVAGDNGTIILGSGANTVSAGSGDTVIINGGGNVVSLKNDGSVTINDSRTVPGGYTGNLAFSDSISLKNSGSIALNYTANVGDSTNVTLSFNPSLSLKNGTSVSTAYVVNAGKADLLNFTGSLQSILLNLGAGDTVTSTGNLSYYTIGGTAQTKSAFTIGATGCGNVFDGGLGMDTFSAGAGYNGGNMFRASARSNLDGFLALGTCINYAGIATRVVVDLNAGVGRSYDSQGNLLWVDGYLGVQQVKAAMSNGNDLTASNAFFSEIKGGLGSVTFHGGASGDRIIWSSAGQTGLNDGQGLDVAYGGSGADEFYWRNSPGGKGVSNFGETVYNFNVAQGDDLNLSEFSLAGFAGVTKAFGGAGDLGNWVNVSLSADSTDTYIQFDRAGSGNFGQNAAVLKNDNLFADFGISDYSTAGAQQVVQSFYGSGHLVLTHSY